MNLKLCEIHTTKRKGQYRWQFTVEADYNVPDQKEDIGRILSEQGQVLLDEFEQQENRGIAKGTIRFQMLYGTNQEHAMLECMEGTIPFEETVHLQGMTAKDEVMINPEIEDLTISAINSRKITLRLVLVLQCMVLEEATVEGASELENCDEIQCLYQTIPYTRTVTRKKDVFRLKEEIILPQSKPNICQMVWNQVSMNHLELRLADGVILLKGELELFALYYGEEEHIPVQTVTMQIPFEGNLDCPEGKGDMIGDILGELRDVSVMVRPDEDGEERKLELEGNLNLSIQIYEDCSVSLLSDLYSPQANVITEMTEIGYETLVMRNHAKVRVADRISLEKNLPNMLQICQVTGSVRIEEQQIVNQGIMVEGVILCQAIYVSDEDKNPIACVKGTVPFSYLIENHVNPEDTSILTPYLDSISGMVVGNHELEIKASVTLSSMVFASHKKQAMISMTVEPMDYERINKIPGMLGYIVKEGDTIWGIAKKYYTTIDSIRKINQLEQDELQAGRKLLIVKGC